MQGEVCFNAVTKNKKECSRDCPQSYCGADSIAYCGITDQVIGSGSVKSIPWERTQTCIDNFNGY